MYIPKHFEETRTDVLHAFMRAHPFAALVVAHAGGLEASHVPVLIDASPGPHGTLRGHVARANPLWRAFDGSTQALIIFGTPGVYVTPSWYATKLEHGKVVPTWDYTVVHAKGVVHAREDGAWLTDHVAHMVAAFEDHRDEPWRVSDAPADFIEKLTHAIVGFEIPIDSLVGQWKVSQNRKEADRDGVARGLREQGDDESRYIADLVEARGRDKR